VDRRPRARRGDPDAERSATERVDLDDLGRVTGVGAMSEAARFAGIARLSPRAVACLVAIADRNGGSLAQAAMPELLRALIAHGLEVRAVETATGSSSTAHRIWRASSWGPRRRAWSGCGRWCGSARSVVRSAVASRSGDPRPPTYARA